MDTTFLEQYYEKVILPLYYDTSIIVLRWKDHGQVGPDAWAHYFENGKGTEFILLNEDFPGGDYLNDGLSHTVVRLPGDKNRDTLCVTITDTWIPNISGYFTLYKEKNIR